MKYPLSATFIDEISFDIESQNWSLEDWRKDLEAMKEIGIDTIVFIRGGLDGKCIYPSKFFPTIYTEENDLLGFMLNAAEELGINVYIGFYMVNANWNNGNYEESAKLNKIFVDEVMQRYGHHKNFIGWYLPFEICKDEFNIVETMRTSIDIIKRKTPDKLIYWCPLFRSKVLEPNDWFTYEKTYEVWDDLLKRIGDGVDFISFTEGTAPADEYEEYLKAVKRATDKYGIQLWANIETFDRLGGGVFVPTTIEKLKRKIEISSKYCVKLNNFEFSHFMSPHSVHETAKQLYEEYKEYYGK